MSSFLNKLMASFGIPGISGSEVWPWLGSINLFLKVSQSLKGLEYFYANPGLVMNS
jgi:hypothetical protein